MKLTENQKRIVNAISNNMIISIAQYVRYADLGFESINTQSYYSDGVSLEANRSIYIIDESKRKILQEFISLIYLLEKNDLIRLKATQPNENYASLYRNDKSPNGILLHECIGYLDQEFRPLNSIDDFIDQNYETDAEISNKKSQFHSIIANYFSFGFGALAIIIAFLSLSYQIKQSKIDIVINQRSLNELVDLFNEKGDVKISQKSVVDMIEHINNNLEVNIHQKTIKELISGITNNLIDNKNEDNK